MNPQRVWAVIVRQGYEFRHNGNQLTNTLYWPVMNVVLWGFFAVYLRQGGGLRPSVITALLGAVILWGLFIVFQRDMALGFLEEVWSQNLVNLFGSPLRVSEYVGGLVAANLGKVLIALVAQSLVALLFYRYGIFSDLPAFVPFILNLMLFAFAVGLVITGLVLRYSTKLQAMAWSFASLLMPLSCVLYPLSSLPAFLRPIAWVLPTTQSFEGMRAVIDGRGFLVANFAWGLALNVVYCAFATLFFYWMFESARSRGLLVKTA
jgi:ABC-2 type transport system permease protein